MVMVILRRLDVACVVPIVAASSSTIAFGWSCDLSLMDRLQALLMVIMMVIWNGHLLLWWRGGAVVRAY